MKTGHTAVVTTAPESTVQPTVSVVIPAYNAVGTIERALNSVYAQTYPNIIEVIVVDDGSQDNTYQTIERQFPLVKLIRQENAGSATARNHGVAEAQGEFIAFLDDDDEWFPEKTIKQMAVFASHPGIVFTTATAIHVDVTTSQEPVAGLEQLTFRHVFPRYDFQPGCSGWIIRRSTFAEVGGFRANLRRAQDVEFLWHALGLGYSFCRLMEPLYKYYPSQYRQSAADVAQRLDHLHAGLMPVVAEYASMPPGCHWLSVDETTAAVSYWHCILGHYLQLVGRYEDARCEFLEAARMRPHGIQRGLACMLARCWPNGIWVATRVEHYLRQGPWRALSRRLSKRRGSNLAQAIGSQKPCP